MLTALETTIIKGLIHDETYTRRVLPYVKDSYFEATTGRTYFAVCKEYFSNYDSCPSSEALQLAVGNIDGLSDDEFRELGECFDELVSPLDVNTDWLIDET